MIRPPTAVVVPPPPLPTGPVPSPVPPARARAKARGRGSAASAQLTDGTFVESPPIQIAHAELLVNTDFGKTKVWGEMDAMALVHYIKLRASRGRETGVIHIMDCYKRSGFSHGLGMETRLYSGYRIDSADEGAATPPSIRAEQARGVPDCLLGRSTLQLPKVCRFLFFVDSPTHVLEHDLMVAHLRAAAVEAIEHHYTHFARHHQPIKMSFGHRKIMFQHHSITHHARDFLCL